MSENMLFKFKCKNENEILKLIIFKTLTLFDYVITI